jgi:dihydrofolate reductase
MRKVTFGCASSLDNFIARKDGIVDWIMWSDEAAEIMKDYWSKIDTMIVGRKTWDLMQSGPKPKTKSKKTKNLYSGIKTYVFSRTLEPGERDGAVILADDPGEFVGKLKQQDGKEICIMSGGDLAKNLFEAGVIDEIGFNIHPVLLGSGVPLFYEMSHQIDLELISCRPFKNSCVYMLYKVKKSAT